MKMSPQAAHLAAVTPPVLAFERSQSLQRSRNNDRLGIKLNKPTINTQDVSRFLQLC